MNPIYSIRNGNGLSGRAWSHEYSSRDAAAEAIREAYGWAEVVLSPSFSDTDGDGEERTCWAAYATYDECDADDTAADAPWIIRS